MEKKSKKFLKKPLYKGGKKALDLFIKNNLKYPEKAHRDRIEGKVLIEYTVNDNGEIIKSEVLKGIGYGCDEEAQRLVELLRYQKVRNRGVISTFKYKLSINFKLPKKQKNQQIQLNYNIVPTKKVETAKEEETSKKMGYTITIKPF